MDKKKLHRVTWGRDSFSNKYNNLKQKSYKILCTFMLLIFLLFLLMVLSDFDNPLISSVIVVGSILYVLVLVFLYRKFKKMEVKTHNKIAIFLALSFFVISSIWGVKHQALLVADILHIADKALVMVNTNIKNICDDVYFSRFPNQIPAVLLVYIVEFFGNLLFHSPENFIIVYNCFMMSLTIYFIYKIIKELFDSKIALIGMILALLYPSFILSSSFYYTDILSIPFPIIGFYCLIKANRENKVKKYIYLVLGGILFGIGTKIRVVSSFLFIAYLIDLILKQDLKQCLKKGGTALASFALIFIVYSSVLLPYFQVNIDKKQTLPATHFLMMGANPLSRGGFYGPDVNFSIAQKNKKEANLEKIKERAKDLNLDFYFKKIALTWTDNQNGIASFYQNMLSFGDTHSFLAGYNDIFLRSILKIMRFVMYLFFFIMIAEQLRKKENSKTSKTSVFIIALFGSFVFYLFWEAKERYSFSFIPWIILGGSTSIVFLDQVLSAKSFSFNNERINLNKFKKKTGILLLLILVLFLVDGFIEYSVRKKEIDMIRANNYYGTIGIPIKNNDEIIEYFKIDDNFNQIELSFFDYNIKQKIPYIFELYNKDDKLIYREEFLSSLHEDRKQIVFDFPKIKVKKKTEFYFKVYSKKATATNFLQIIASRNVYCNGKELTCKNKGYDMNPEGKTYVNGKLYCFDAMYKVVEHKMSNRVRKKYYLPFAIFIFGISFIGVYSCLIKKE